jgi:uncharacterized protein YifE (UPF0438 family)
MAFKIQCATSIFDEDEKELLKRYGKAFQELMYGFRAPATPQQQHFLDVCHDNATPENEYERVWHKYLSRLKYEKNLDNHKPRRLEDTSFGGSRRAYSNMKRQSFGDFMKRNRGG